MSARPGAAELQTERSQIVGRGVVASEGTVMGTLRRAFSVHDVVELIGSDLGHAILWTEYASVTSLVPIFADVRGVICEGGGITSHVAIVARQFGMPCLVAAEFDPAVTLKDGARVAIEANGEIRLIAAN